MAKEKSDYPQRCYVLKAAKDIYEVTGENEFTSDDLLKELVVTNLPNINKKSLSVMLATQFGDGKFIEFTGKSIAHGQMKTRRLTEAGKNTDWRKMPLSLKKKQSTIKTEVKKIPAPKEEKGPEITTEEKFDWAQTLVDYINHLNSENKAWSIQFSDMERKLKEEIKDWKNIISEKNNTIADLNNKITIMNKRVQRSNSNRTLLGDVAKFKGSQKRL